ncbi:hypothetical protein [Acidithiobacillus ferriphilus]|uniref:hypothetical protein n=1 Tax=Acidithiobacillus ferriphilus TaxID=1689834 RepID=UPI002DB7D03F|nr:hypothetical protein [Acidithiobacillus ferriphilus]MEB8535972.1 hypothetical protein [Acidithiobacillus ferriphilus]
MKLFAMMLIAIFAPLLIFGSAVGIFAGEIYMMHHHILGMSMNHGSGPTYKLIIMIPIGWIIGTGTIFIRFLEKLAKS